MAPRRPADDSDDSDSLYTAGPAPRRAGAGANTLPSKTATATSNRTGSDKENRVRFSNNDDGIGGDNDEEDEDEDDDDEEEEEGDEEPRRDKGKGRATQALHERVIAEEVDKKFYDPDQKPEERRRLRKGLRELGRSLYGMLRCVFALSRPELCPSHFFTVSTYAAYTDNPP